jgi:hypothetical protein
VSSIMLDGTALPASDFTAIPGSSYSGAQVAVGFGSHTVSASLPFGLTVYGYGGYDAYGYPGGFTLSPIATVSKVTLAPTSSSYTTGSSACETATVTDQNDQPVSGVRVDFAVTGVNPNSGFAYSAANGTAQYCYTGTAAGVDTEGASVGAVTSNSASISWTKSTSTCTTAVGRGSTGKGDVGTVVNNLSTTLSAHQQFEFTWNDHAHHVNLVTLATAKCGTNDRKAPGLTFTGTGTATLDGVSGYSILFAISSSSTGPWVVGVQIKQGSVVVGTFTDTLTVSSESLS